MSENNFLEQNSQHRECKTGDSGKTGNKNSNRAKYKHNGNDEKRICVRSKHKYEIKLKIKGTKRSISQQFQIKQNYPKSRNNQVKQRTTMS